MKDTENPVEDLQPATAPTVAVVISKKESLVSLLSTGLATARIHHGILTVFFVSQTEDTPDWVTLPAEYDSAGIAVQSVTGKIVSVC